MRAYIKTDPELLNEQIFEHMCMRVLHFSLFSSSFQ